MSEPGAATEKFQGRTREMSELIATTDGILGEEKNAYFGSS